MKNKSQISTKQKQSSFTLTQMALPGIVLILVGLVLLIKAYSPSSEVATTPTQARPTLAATSVQPSSEVATTQVRPTPTVVATSANKESPSATPIADMLPELQLEQLKADGKPTLAFFHSNNCLQCIKMIDIVEQIHPDFAEKVALVDVNVYDARNQNLLNKIGIRLIPTMIFINHDGQGAVYTGPMESAEFRAELQRLAKQ